MSERREGDGSAFGHWKDSTAKKIPPLIRISRKRKKRNLAMLSYRIFFLSSSLLQLFPVFVSFCGSQTLETGNWHQNLSGAFFFLPHPKKGPVLLQVLVATEKEERNFSLSFRSFFSNLLLLFLLLLLVYAA